MTLGEAKNKVYMLLDEHSAGGDIDHDEDIELKMRFFFDIAQKEIAKTAKIVKVTRINRRSGKELYAMPSDFRSLYRVWRNGKISAKYRFRGRQLFIPENDRADDIQVEYFAVPETIPENAADDYEFQVNEEAANCMPYYVAAQQLLPDLVMDYGAMLTMYNMAVSALSTAIPGEGTRMRQAFYRA